MFISNGYDISKTLDTYFRSFVNIISDTNFHGQCSATTCLHLSHAIMNKCMTFVMT